MYKGTLQEVLTKIGEQLSLSPEKLIEYANDAPWADVRPDGNPWPSGTGSINEKRILYAIARATNPILALDIGTRWGAMALQIATGNHNAPPPSGRVISVDIETHMFGSKQQVGKFIPQHLEVELVNSDIVAYLKRDDKHYELIFEDTDHTYETTVAIYSLAVDKLVPGGVIISHDAIHPKFKNAVVQGIAATGINPYVYIVEGDSCGMAIWQKPTQPDTDKNWTAETIVMDDLHQQTKIDHEAVKEAPKRRKRRSKKASKIKSEEL